MLAPRTKNTEQIRSFRNSILLSKVLISGFYTCFFNLPRKIVLFIFLSLSNISSSSYSLKNERKNSERSTFFPDPHHHQSSCEYLDFPDHSKKVLWRYDDIIAKHLEEFPKLFEEVENLHRQQVVDQEVKSLSHAVSVTFGNDRVVKLKLGQLEECGFVSGSCNILDGCSWHIFSYLLKSTLFPIVHCTISEAKPLEVNQFSVFCLRCGECWVLQQLKGNWLYTACSGTREIRHMGWPRNPPPTLAQKQTFLWWHVLREASHYHYGTLLNALTCQTLC